MSVIKPLSNAEKQKRKTGKLKNEGKCEIFKKKKAEVIMSLRQKQKDNMAEKETDC